MKDLEIMYAKAVMRPYSVHGGFVIALGRDLTGTELLDISESYGNAVPVTNYEAIKKIEKSDKVYALYSNGVSVHNPNGVSLDHYNEWLRTYTEQCRRE